MTPEQQQMWAILKKSDMANRGLLTAQEILAELRLAQQTSTKTPQQIFRDLIRNLKHARQQK